MSGLEFFALILSGDSLFFFRLLSSLFFVGGFLIGGEFLADDGTDVIGGKLRLRDGFYDNVFVHIVFLFAFGEMGFEFIGDDGADVIGGQRGGFLFIPFLA